MAKRTNEPLAKDYELVDWLVMADQAIESLPEYREDHFANYIERATKEPFLLALTIGATFRHVPDWAITAIAQKVPTVTVRYIVGPNRVRETRVFPVAFVYKLMEFLRLDRNKYTSKWNVKSIAMCKIGDVTK